MTEDTPLNLGQTTRDLLRSLHDTILRLRNQAEGLLAQLEQHGSDALDQAEKQQVAKLDSLIRDCQKVEKTLAEQPQRTGATDSGLDLEAARAEISRRLDRLRATHCDQEPAGGAE